jgi:hypothetical protein
VSWRPSIQRERHCTRSYGVVATAPSAPNESTAATAMAAREVPAAATGAQRGSGARRGAARSAMKVPSTISDSRGAKYTGWR